MTKSPNPIYPGITRRLRRIPFEEIPKAFFQGSQLYGNTKIQCKCGTKFDPPWHKELEFEQPPLQSKDGGIFVLSGMLFPCPICKTENEFHFPEVRSRGKIHLFGDEAGEWFGNSYLHLYAFAGLKGDYKKKIDEALALAKAAIRPRDNPAEWHWHTWEIRNTRWRNKHDVKLEISEINAVIRTLAEALSAGLDKRLLSAIVFPPFGRRENNKTNRKSVVADARDQTLTAAIIGLTEVCTRNGLGPQFTIESQSTSYRDNQMDYFVERIGRGLHRDLNFHYVCRGRNVGLPDTIPKGSCLELEIADIIAFMVRRFFFASNAGTQTEFPLELLGTLYWGALTPIGFMTTSHVGFPYQQFFPSREMGLGK